ncbi:helix-turn-helix domain-containing protein [Bacillus atrophaeus]|uniref:helix-turn-helix domain-containing protein n=1 Tax=Bacillus atrophaeus TaxID=1452 RepID=UPI0022810A73|nr:helix-turn-helix domain-containing protein [Bacillus atrophaeus]MCY8918092.1 helix-turn-helix domain-containing protein [Bacillus atrophaeus]MCY8923202.1 helix-turn-helix domain-containing protein [Bacillus atrophaeus]
MFSDNLKKCRKQKKLTQQNMADKLGITRPAYTAYELGTREPDYKILIGISNILDVSLDYLLKGEADETHKKVFEEEAKKIINDPDTFIAARDGNVTDEILEAALEIITEQLKEGRKPKK